jgi:hypothetical protein
VIFTLDYGTARRRCMWQESIHEHSVDTKARSGSDLAMPHFAESDSAFPESTG